MGKITNIVVGGVVGIGALFLLTGVITGCNLNGTVAIQFQDLGLEIKEKKYTVSWINCDGTLLEKDTELTSGSKAFYNGEEPTMEGYVFIGWDQAQISVNDYYYVVVDKSDVTCTAVYEPIPGYQSTEQPQE